MKTITLTQAEIEEIISLLYPDTDGMSQIDYATNGVTIQVFAFYDEEGHVEQGGYHLGMYEEVWETDRYMPKSIHIESPQGYAIDNASFEMLQDMFKEQGRWDV